MVDGSVRRPIVEIGLAQWLHSILGTALNVGAAGRRRGRIWFSAVALHNGLICGEAAGRNWFSAVFGALHTGTGLIGGITCGEPACGKRGRNWFSAEVLGPHTGPICGGADGWIVGGRWFQPTPLPGRNCRDGWIHVRHS